MKTEGAKPTAGRWEPSKGGSMILTEGGERIVAFTASQPTLGELAANAFLLAAAPELLAALEGLLAAYEDGTRQCHCTNGGHDAPAPCDACAARAAILKARGEQQPQQPDEGE